MLCYGSAREEPDSHRRRPLCGPGALVVRLPPRGDDLLLSDHIENLYVESFKNQTKWVDMDQRLMEALTLEWVRRGRLRLVDSRAKADVVLTGAIQGLAVIPVSYDDQGRANEYQISIQAGVQLVDVRGEDDAVSWEDKAFSRRTSYWVI